MMGRIFFKTQSGFSLVEVLVAIGLLSVGGMAIVMLLGNSHRSTQAGGDRTQAAFLAAQTYEAVRSVGADAYNRLIDGAYSLDDSAGVWSLAATSDELGRFSRTLRVETAARDAFGNLAESGARDIHTKKITAAIAWDYLGQGKIFEFVSYFANWDCLDLFHDAAADFDGGSLDRTEIIAHGNGALALTAIGRVLDAPVFFDASGTHNANALAVQGTVAYLARDNSNSDTELVAVDVSDPGNPVQLGTLELGTTAKDIAVSGDYAYLATIANSYEFLVVNIENPAAMFVAASLDLARNADALSVEVSGSRAYVTRGGSADPDVYLINIANPASPSVVGSYQIGASVYASAYDPNTRILYVGAATNNSLEFHSLDVSNEAAPVELDGLGLPGNQNIHDVVLDVENRIAYVGRYFTQGSQNIFSIDISDPHDLRVMSSLSTGGHGNSLVFNEEFLFVANNKTGSQLLIVDLRDPWNMHVEDSISLNDVGLGLFLLDGVLYIASANDQGELIIATVYHGGEFETAGVYVSPVLDALAPANWNTIEWHEDLSCPDSDIELQIRTAATALALPSELWQGPDGKDADETDFYTDPEGALLPTDHNSDRYFQYRAIFSGPGSCTPYLEDIRITYTPY